MDVTDAAGMNQYLTFTLGDEHFAMEIGKVREVLDYTNITRVPRMPTYLRGVINLRGNVVPVVDLRLTLGMTAVEKTVDTCIMIVEASANGTLVHVGMLADAVQEVIDIDPGQIQPPPRLGTRLDVDFIKGMGHRGDDTFLVILDIDRVLSDEAKTAIVAALDASAQGMHT
jgi:purine-binding chemotaxis protein CheW